MNSLNAISPIDGRYRSKVDALASYFSEGALIRYRVRVEIEYFIALGQIPQLPLQKLFAQRPELQNDLRAIYQNFTDDDALEVKEIEKTTNHDVKAVEYFIKRRFDTLGLEASKCCCRATRLFSRSSRNGHRSGRTSPCWPTPTVSPRRPRRWVKR